MNRSVDVIWGRMVVSRRPLGTRPRGEVMADCDETLRQLYAYLDRVLDDEARAEIGSHVNDCPDCTERVEFEYSLLIHLRRRSKEEPIPDDLRIRLLECFDVDVSGDTRRTSE